MVTDDDPVATVIVIVSLSPAEGEFVVADKDVVDGVSEVVAGQTPSKLLKSIDPRPEASS